MIKPTTSWWVPVSSFAIAVVLAFAVGPKSSLHARPPGGATAPCTSELTNLDVTSTVSGFDTTAVATVDLNAGVPSANNLTWLYNHAHVVLSVTTKKGPSTYEVDMKPIPASSKVPAAAPSQLGVHFTAGTKFNMACTNADLDAAVRSAILKKVIKSENPGSRTPLRMHVNVHAETTELGLGKLASCKDDITLTFSTIVDLLGTGSGHGNAP